MSSPWVGANHLSLSKVLRERTSALHTEAERSGVINDILRQKADRRSYALLLRNLLPAYEKMEQALERQHGSATLRVFAQPALRRAERIAADLEALSGADWICSLPLLTAGELYAARVQAAGEGDGSRLLAHAYVRYFGDLSGGQVLKRLLGKSLKLGPQSLSFYDFPGISDLKAVKDDMRDAIDQSGAGSVDVEPIILEGIRAFEHNIEVSHAVQAFANTPA